MNTLIVGTGKLGQRFYNYVKDQGENPITLSRSEKDWSDNHITFDLGKAGNDLPALPQLSEVFIILAPDEKTEIAYRQTYVHAVTRLIEVLHKQQQDFHCTFVSSTSVYSGNTEDVIDESVAANPTHFTGKALLEAEKNLLKQHPNTSIVRASGLYSDERQRMVDSLLDKEKYDEPKWLNVIHEDDLCHWLYFAADREVNLSIASDGKPFTRAQLQDYVSGKQFAELEPSKIYKSGLLKRIRLRHPSIFSWAKQKLDAS